MTTPAEHGDATVEELNTLLGRAYDRSKNQRKLIERQRDEIAVLVRERDNARAERDAAQAKSAKLAADLLDQKNMTEAERTVKEAAWTETKGLRERLNKIAAHVVKTADLADVPPF